ncbi:MAG: hypothetical protein Greene041619_244 [Candidatus Peregrinibacteria bacterium Greene0416_19]|nr:MAG: hypothetical protein Greene041619_244 [Candidatus Peregrinibacteria bacterium Greene0416_19]
MSMRLRNIVMGGSLVLLLSACTGPSPSQPLTGTNRAGRSCLYQGTADCHCTTGTPGRSECLIDTEEGEMIAEFPEGSLDALFRVTTRDGMQAEVSGPYGVDRVEVAQPGIYLVYAANRESDNPKSFDTVFGVSFGDKPEITTLIPETGFGGFDKGMQRFAYVPASRDPAAWTLVTRDILGEQSGEYAFGKEFVRLPGYKEAMMLSAAEVLGDGDLLLFVSVPGLTTSKDGPFARFVVSPDEKRIFAMQ